MIFLGTVESIENRPWSEFWPFIKQTQGFSWRQRYDVFRDEIIVNFSVNETFKGNTSKTTSVRINKFLGACGFEWPEGLYFRKGAQYLVYATEWKGGHLWTTHCSRTQLASEVAKDIEGFRKLRQQRMPSLIGDYAINRDATSQISPVGQILSFKANDGKVLTAPLAADGHFSLEAVAPGQYEVEVTTPPKYKIGSASRYRRKDGVPVNPKMVTVGDDTCTEIALEAYPDGQISGVVVDAKGRPFTDAHVLLWHADDIKTGDPWWYAEGVDAAGRFTKTSVFPGEYVIGVYVWSAEQERLQARGQDVTPSLWFCPGVTDPKQAKRVSLKLAEHRTGLRIVLPVTH